MTFSPEHVDVFVVGSGPAGQKAAVQAAKAGRSVVLAELEVEVGGACVERGTIPSKTLRETAMALANFRRRSGGVFTIEASPDLKLHGLMRRMDEVVHTYQRTIAEQLARNGVTVWRGRARFLSPHEVEVVAVSGLRRVARATTIVVATGSRPRAPQGIAVDHDAILDSDSILSMSYLPETLGVMGSGVIACEYASIFAALGVRVQMLDRAPRPLAFLDTELSERFERALETARGTYRGGVSITSAATNGLGGVSLTLDSGETLACERLFVAQGRVANLESLDVAAAGLAVTERGLLQVDGDLRTSQPHIYGAGDVVGPPALAATSMEQGRRAVCHALGLPVGDAPELIPIGIYTIPEISTVGLAPAQVAERHGGVLVGRAAFAEIARGRIAALDDGLLKLIATPDGRTLCGVQIVGEGAADLIHIGQMALVAGAGVDVFIDTIFNFPTLAECYRVAALDILRQRGPASSAVPSATEALEPASVS